MNKLPAMMPTVCFVFLFKKLLAKSEIQKNHISAFQYPDDQRIFGIDGK